MYAFRIFVFSEIPEILETQAHKKFNLQHNRESKISRIMVYCTNPQIKMS